MFLFLVIALPVRFSSLYHWLLFSYERFSAFHFSREHFGMNLLLGRLYNHRCLGLIYCDSSLHMLRRNINLLGWWSYQIFNNSLLYKRYNRLYKLLINYLGLICSDNLTKCNAWSCYSLLSIYYLGSLNGPIKCYLLWLGISLSYLPRRSKLPWRCIYYLSTSHNIIRNLNITTITLCYPIIWVLNIVLLFWKVEALLPPILVTGLI